ncbi:threonine aldolase family protein [Balneola sp. MJW-20]|uniref:threonine aldolase family protein n=1 Tax=Gracilimonas aurantiaca TaxID=3234185 RepID=UPI00346555DB
MIDLRSDTVTKPTPEMLQAMTMAEVGDDVFAGDPTVNAFQEKVAARFGMEAGLFVPSGTMSNQLGIKVLTEPGDEILIDEKGHIFNYETGATPFLSGVQIQTVHGERGKIRPEMLQNRSRGEFDWEPVTKVICIENSTNKGGGVCYTEEELKAIKDFADEENLRVHVDGARIWNAIVASGVKASYFGEIADTISVCFSKGLGAPVGSMLLGSEEMIRKARRYRKMWGGGMRQVGLLAAAAEYALDNHWKHMEQDHKNARMVAEVIAGLDDFKVDLNVLETNILMFDTITHTAAEVLEILDKEGVAMIPFGPNTIRATFHFQVSREEVEEVISILKNNFH